MKLYLVHAGFYDKNISGGFYESHTNYFIAAKNITEAKKKAKLEPEFEKKNMHIDGIRELNEVQGYSIKLIQSNSDINSEKIYSYDDVKKI